MSSVVNIRKAHLEKRGISDFEEWDKDPNNLYIGKNILLKTAK